MQKRGAKKCALVSPIDKSASKEISNSSSNYAASTRSTSPFRCGVQHISRLRRELKSQGLNLRNVAGVTQRQTLLLILQYLGPRGLNTLEAVGLGFYRIATRIQELEEADGWLIASQRERLIGADGLLHSGIARYVLIGRRADYVVVQGSLWEAA